MTAALGVQFFEDIFSARGYLAEHNNDEEEWFQNVVAKVVDIFEELTEEQL